MGLKCHQPQTFVEKFCCHVRFMTDVLAISVPLRQLSSCVQVKRICVIAVLRACLMGWPNIWMTKRICLYISTYHSRCLSPPNYLLNILLRG
jgi:hypothetical protein